jgi:alkylation response protein AidB-like acyl-CoA dehydrogenase
MTACSNFTSQELSLPTITSNENPARRLLDAGWNAPLDLPEDLMSVTDHRKRLLAVAETNFVGIGIPADFGGGGGTILDMAAAQRQLALLDPGLAIGLCMHSHSIGVMVEHHRRVGDTSWMLLEAIANRHCLVGSAFAEPGGSANLMRSKTTARKAGRGYVLNGVKFPCSLATTAELFCLNAATDTGETIVALCAADADGLVADGKAWPAVGMGSSDTGKLTLTDVALDDRLIYHRAPSGTTDSIVTMGFVWFAVLMAATYHGVLTRTIELAAGGAKAAGTIAGDTRSTLLGQASRELLALGGNAHWLGQVWAASALDERSALGAAMALRAQTSATRDRVMAALTPVIGSRLYVTGQLVNQLSFDSLAVHHHPPALLVCDNGVGSTVLGQHVDFDVNEHAA